NVVDAGMFKGIVLNSSMVLSHMFCADDAVFMGQWSNSNIDTIIYALKCFERASGLRMNMSKSKIMGIVVNGDKVDQVAHRIGCGILEVPFTYLGVGEISGGILYLWDTNSFKKLNATVSDYFILLRGNWVSNGKLLLIVSVYAPQELTKKKMLCGYLMHVMASWKCDVIIMGDFNEVRYSSERFGSNFNVIGANAFNSFIIQAGLEEAVVRLLGVIKVDGFEKLIVETWSDNAACGSNDMLNLMYKLKNLKKKIGGWNSMRQSFKNSKIMLKSKLADVELVIDKGNASEEVIYKRLEIVNSINELEKQQSMETANNLAIRGVLEAGKWIENQDLVKKEFLNHFKNRFGRPNKTRPVLVTEFSRQLNSMQHMDMEADVTIEEIKNAVWDCGTDKSPGPNGFSFDFYRRFWSVIQKDVVAVVKCFFIMGLFLKGVIHPS
nr:RNA-directed DNA polymerase, eukaryota [Tanacetum cinerariifolium]